MVCAGTDNAIEFHSKNGIVGHICSEEEPFTETTTMFHKIPRLFQLSRRNLEKCKKLSVVKSAHYTTNMGCFVVDLKKANMANSCRKMQQPQ